MVLVCEKGKEEESVQRLARVGFENIPGYLTGGFENWLSSGKPFETISTIDPKEFASKVKDGARVLDVRKFSEAEDGHVKNATIIPLAELEKNQSLLNKKEALYVHCAGGYRSMIASSLLKARGFENIINVRNGWSKIKDCGVEVSTDVPENIVIDK